MKFDKILQWEEYHNNQYFYIRNYRKNLKNILIWKSSAKNKWAENKAIKNDKKKTFDQIVILKTTFTVWGVPGSCKN